MTRFKYKTRHNGYTVSTTGMFVDFHECYQFIRDTHPFDEIVSIVEVT